MQGDRIRTDTEEVHTMRYFFPLELDLALQSRSFRLAALTAYPDVEKPASANECWPRWPPSPSSWFIERFHEDRSLRHRHAASLAEAMCFAKAGAAALANPGRHTLELVRARPRQIRYEDLGKSLGGAVASGGLAVLKPAV